MAPKRILIVGCSIGGPTLASFLLMSDIPAKDKPQITILEQASEVRKEGQNIDIRGAGVTLIHKLGIEKAVRAATTGEEGVRIVDAQNRIWAEFGADRSGQTSTPTADIEILRGTLAWICWKRSEDLSKQVQKDGGAGIEYIFGDRLDEISQDGQEVTVHFAKRDEKRTYDLVVGADGLQSQTRAMVWGQDGESERLKRLGMYAGFFSMPKGETDSQWRRWFHASGRRGIMTRPSEYKDKATVFIYTINENDSRLPKVATRGHRDVNAQKALLAEYFKDAGWESDRIIREMMETNDFYYDMVAQVKLDRWNKGRVVLLGDAGYCASPLSGMGTTLAMTGAYNLAGALMQHGNDYSAAFEQYHVKMRPTVERAQKLAPGMPYLMNPETAWGVWVLNAFGYMIYMSGLISLLSRFAGPPAHSVPVDDYGFINLPDLVVEN